ncbi:MAG TPA: hypothetical protein VGP18_08420 [Solirubrobacteraceae bacterium]|jgi:hypothetical protein|nr:hypothetical protein [Solirubrobacteraceae bacterium]
MAKSSSVVAIEREHAERAHHVASWGKDGALEAVTKFAQGNR